MKFDNLFFHCSPCISVSLFSQPGLWRLYGDRNVQAEQPRSSPGPGQPTQNCQLCVSSFIMCVFKYAMHQHSSVCVLRDHT